MHQQFLKHVDYVALLRGISRIVFKEVGDGMRNKRAQKRLETGTKITKTEIIQDASLHLVSHKCNYPKW